MIDKIKELVRIPSITAKGPKGDMPYGEVVNQALEYVLGLCDQLGFRTKNCENRIGYAEIGEGPELIGILCHLDVVPPGQGWSVDPFGAVEKDSKLYGRGIIDDKGPAIAAIYAMKEVLETKKILKKRVRIIFGLQEESGDWEDIGYYKATEEIPCMGFTPDSKFPAIYCEKGIAQLHLTIPLETAGLETIQGGQAANMVADFAQCMVKNHAGELITFSAKGVSAHGSRPEEGENAITKMMEQVYQQECAGTLTCPFARWYMEQIGYDLYGEKLGCALMDASGRLTLNAGIVAVDAAAVSLVVDIRHPISKTAEEISKMIEKSVEPYDVQVSLVSKEKPVYMEKGGRVITALMEAYRQITGDEEEAQIIGGGTYARAMPNIVAFGPAFPGQERMEHKADEYAYIEDLYRAKDIYCQGILNLLKL